MRAELERIRQHGEDNDYPGASGWPSSSWPAALSRASGRWCRWQVDGAAVAAVISSWTGVPAGRMLRDDIHGLLDRDGSARRAGGRPGPGDRHHLPADPHRRRRARGSRQAQGFSCWSAATGAGKTETAIALADLLSGGVQNLVTVNMSELQEAHSVATLRGSPPGYVGFGAGRGAHRGGAAGRTA